VNQSNVESVSVAVDCFDGHPDDVGFPAVQVRRGRLGLRLRTRIDSGGIGVVTGLGLALGVCVGTAARFSRRLSTLWLTASGE